MVTDNFTATDRYGAGVEKAEVRHTPGPWHACKDGACTCKAVWCADHPIADVTSGEWGDDYPAIRLDQEGIGAKAEAYMERFVYGSIDPSVAAANARLIAAAPDLLAAGKLCPDRADFGTASDYADAVDAWWRNEMLPALSKATGGSDE